MSALGDRLRALRAPLKQAELARKFDISPALLSSWESGKAMPPLHRLQAYADYFDPGGSALLMDLCVLSGTALPQQQTQAGDLVEILTAIRWVLVEIRDRLPPPPA